MEARPNAVKSNIAQELEIIGPMNQGKLEVIKEKTARMNADILGISELKWTGMGKFNSDDYYIYYCGQGKWLNDLICKTEIELHA